MLAPCGAAGRGAAPYSSRSLRGCRGASAARPLQQQLLRPAAPCRALACASPLQCSAAGGRQQPCAAAAGLRRAGLQRPRGLAAPPHQQQQRRLPPCPAPQPRQAGWQTPQQQPAGGRSVGTAAIAGTLTATGIIPLGYDFLTFLTATVLVVPACKMLKLSPVLGFLAAGVALEQAG